MFRSRDDKSTDNIFKWSEWDYWNQCYPHRPFDSFCSRFSSVSAGPGISNVSPGISNIPPGKSNISPGWIFAGLCQSVIRWKQYNRGRVRQPSLVWKFSWGSAILSRSNQILKKKHFFWICHTSGLCICVHFQTVSVAFIGTAEHWETQNKTHWFQPDLNATNMYLHCKIPSSIH